MKEMDGALEEKTHGEREREWESNEEGSCGWWSFLIYNSIYGHT